MPGHLVKELSEEMIEMIIGDKYWCITPDQNEVCYTHVKPWYGTLLISPPAFEWGWDVYYMQERPGMPLVYIKESGAELFETEADARVAYIKAETQRVDALHTKWAVARAELETFIDSA